MCKQIKSRFDFSEKFASKFELTNAVCGNIMSIPEGTALFSDLNDIDLEELNLEWQLVAQVDKQYLNCEISAFWGNVLSQKNVLNKPMFENLS